MKVLVVDDSLTIRKIVMHTLQKLQGTHVITEAENGLVGLNHLAQEQFDLVITDWNMPVLNGLDMVQKMRTGKHPHIPVVMLTSNGSPWELIQAYRVGVDGFVTKPMTPHALRSKIRKVMARKTDHSHTLPSYSETYHVAWQ